MRIKTLDDAFVDNIANQLIEEEERARKSLELYEARKDRCDHLRNVLQAKDDEDQTLCLEELPRLPDWKPRRRGQKRVRSRSRSRVNAKRVKVQDQEIPESGNPVQDPGQIQVPEAEIYEETREIRIVDQNREETEEIVVVEIDSDRDLDLEGINDPKPSCRKRMPEKRKSKKKKKKTAPTPARTYDEIIESGIYKNSDDEFDLEAYFSGDIV